MADRIVLGKLGVTFAPAQKITPLRRENRDSHKRRFEHQLTGGDEGNAKETLDPDEGIKNSLESDVKPGHIASTDAEGNLHSVGDSLSDEDTPPGSVVDICV